MSLSHPKELFAFLQQIDARPRKGLSQNFLIDANIVRKIVQKASIAPNDWVLEIGPGPGALTEELLRQGANVIAVEKDRRMAAALGRLQIDGRLHVIEGDFLKLDLAKILQKHAPLKVVANLPYHITTPILEKLAERYELFTSAFVMVQKEMAERMIAPPHSKDRSSFTIFIQTYANPAVAIKVSRNCFYPVPQVDSCVVRLDFHKPVMDDPEGFLKMVRQAFQQRRKMLRSTLRTVEEPFASMRPEALTFDQWLTIRFHH